MHVCRCPWRRGYYQLQVDGAGYIYCTSCRGVVDVLVSHGFQFSPRIKHPELVFDLDDAAQRAAARAELDIALTSGPLLARQR